MIQHAAMMPESTSAKADEFQIRLSPLLPSPHPSHPSPLDSLLPLPGLHSLPRRHFSPLLSLGGSSRSFVKISLLIDGDCEILGECATRRSPCTDMSQPPASSTSFAACFLVL